MEHEIVLSSAIPRGGGGDIRVIALGAKFYGMTFSETKFRIFYSFFSRFKNILGSSIKC